ncbi:MAG: hypothetical protein WD490_01745 [Opitutales bacterium]
MARTDPNAKKGPKTYEIVVGAILSLLLGVFLAAVYMVTTPVEVVDEMPDSPDSTKVYYVTGDAGEQPLQWSQKLGALTSGTWSGAFPVSEQELNQWAQSAFAESNGSGEDGTFVVTPGTPNFRLYGERIQVGADLEYSVFGFGQTIKSQAHGQIIEKGGRFVFEPHELHLGSLPIPRAGGLSSLVFNRLRESFEVSEELKQGWERVSYAAVDESVLRIELPE